MKNPDVILYDEVGWQIGHLRAHEANLCGPVQWTGEYLPLGTAIHGGGNCPIKASGIIVSWGAKTMDEAAEIVRRHHQRNLQNQTEIL